MHSKHVQSVFTEWSSVDEVFEIYIILIIFTFIRRLPCTRKHIQPCWFLHVFFVLFFWVSYGCFYTGTMCLLRATESVCVLVIWSHKL